MKDFCFSIHRSAFRVHRFYVAALLGYNVRPAKERTRMRRPQLGEFMRRMEPDSIAIITSAPERTRSNDTEYRYRQDSDFYYLTGFTEPESIAVIAPAHGEHKYTLFVRPRDPERETWDGRRAGVEGAVVEFGADKAGTVAEFHEQVRELLNGARNLYYRLGVNAELDATIIQSVRAMRARSR